MSAFKEKLKSEVLGFLKEIPPCSRLQQDEDGSVEIGLICLDDFRRVENPSAIVSSLARDVSLLKSFVGKKIESIEFHSEKNSGPNSPKFDPFGNLIRVKVLTS